jgi:disulfide oxidoreductase YuzD
MTKKYSIRWASDVKEANYPSAFNYLSLIFGFAQASKDVEDLKIASIREYQAKDIFRASGLPILPVSNHHVAKDLKKIDNGEELSPILLVSRPQEGKVIIADGYHRLCASYHKNEDEIVKCKIV